jgi:hypothetical protein
MSFTSDYDPPLPVTPLQAASRFDSFFDVFGLSLKQDADLGQRRITLIARSPASPPAQALAMNLGRFQPLSVEVSIIFAQIAPPDALTFMVQSLSKTCRQGPELIIRWAKNRALLDAHERLTLGRTLCWTGDSLRRSEDSRSAIDRVEDPSETMLYEANASFSAIWRASKTLPKMLFSPVGPFAGPQGASRSSSISPAAVEANIVRLDEYLRSRRH